MMRNNNTGYLPIFMFALCLIIACIVTDICHSALGVSAVLPDAMGGQIIEDEVDGFKVYIFLPWDYSMWHKYPLIVGSHGSNNTGMEIIKGWKSVANKRGYIVVAPTIPDATDWSKIDIDKIFIDIVKMVRSKYNIDNARVLMTGNSAGAGHTYYMAIKHPEIFRAAAPSSGCFRFLRGFPWKSGVKKIPIYILHGENDPLFSSDEAYKVKKLLERCGYSVQIYIGTGAGHAYPDMEKTPVPDWIDKGFK